MKIVVALITVIALILLAYFSYNFSKEKIGNLEPSILPNSDNLAKRLIETKTGQKPDLPILLPEGFTIGVFANELRGVRDLLVAPKGTIIASLPSEGKVVALPDKDKNGEADDAITLIGGLRRPHGISFYNGKLYIVEENKVISYLFNENVLIIRKEKDLFQLPVGGRHTTRSIVFDSKGNMYISLGSTCDTCVEDHPFLASVIVSDSEGRAPRVFAKGLRNAVFLTKANDDSIWATEMGRDFLGDNLPPDEINKLSDGGDYGWPFCYGDKIWDSKFGRQNQSYCNFTISPFYKIPSHSAPLGLAFINSPQFPEEMQGDILVAYHGSWNRSVPTGYKIVKVETNGTPQETDFITGFLQGEKALGRPVDLEFDNEGSLYISDDKANAVYKMVKK